MSTVWSAKLMKVSLVLLSKHTETITGNMYSYIHKWLNLAWCDFATTNTCYSCPFCHSQFPSEDAATLHMETALALCWGKCSTVVLWSHFQWNNDSLWNYISQNARQRREWLVDTKCKSPTKRFSYKIIENTLKMRWYVYVGNKYLFKILYFS